MRVDPSVKANLDRIDERKANRLRRVQSLPARGGLGDMVVIEVNGTDVAYAWVGEAWVEIGSAADAPYSSEIGDPYISEVEAP